MIFMNNYDTKLIEGTKFRSKMGGNKSFIWSWINFDFMSFYLVQKFFFNLKRKWDILIGIIFMIEWIETHPNLK